MAIGGLDLLQDVMIKILLSFPINELFQLRCVSKEWRNLIFDPFFRDLIRRRSRNNLVFLMLHFGFQGLNLTCKFSLIYMSRTIHNQVHCPIYKAHTMFTSLVFLLQPLVHFESERIMCLQSLHPTIRNAT